MPILSRPSRYDPDAPGVPVPPEVRAELRRLANLFLVSGVTMALFLVRVFSQALDEELVPPFVWAIWGGGMWIGAAATYVYGLYVTVKARRWLWVLLCAVPVVGSIPCSVAYSWVRRLEIEREVLGGDRSGRRTS
jgi:hypothetical protein